MKELIDISSIVNNLIAALIFALISFAIIYFFRVTLNQRIRNLLITTFKKGIGEKLYETVEIDSTLNEIVEAIENTRFLFFRIGNFNISNPKYNQTIKRLIDELEVWDYHIYLKNALTGSKGFMNDYYEIEKFEIKAVRPITTTELIQINRNDFNRNCKPIFDKYGLKQDYIDIILQGVIQRTSDYPKLKNIESNKISFTNVTIFYANSSIKLIENIVNEFGNDLIESIRNYYNESLYIGKTSVASNDADAIKFGNKILK